MDITQIAYEKYKLDWMTNHGCSLSDLIFELEELRLDNPNAEITELFDDFECNYGFKFGSEIWACFDEFIDNEFLDDDYMYVLLNDKEFVEYKKYVEENCPVAE
jgi:hypothetical protein